MKKQFTLLALLTVTGGIAFGQSAIKPAGTTTQSAPQMFTEKLVGDKPSTTPAPKAGGDLLYSSDFSNPAEWTVGTSGQGTFILGQMSHALITSQTNGLDGYMTLISSTTAANGIAFFNGLQYLIGGNVDPQNTWIESPVYDLTGKSVINVSFEQSYRRFNSDAVYLEMSQDNGATWTSYALNTTAIKNGATFTAPVVMNIQVTGSATTKFRFRWENLSDDNAYGSGYGWMIDDFKILEGFDNNVKIDDALSIGGTQGLPFSKIPVGQTANAPKMSFGAIATNTGGLPQVVTLNVTAGTFVGASNTSSLTSFASDSLTIAQTTGFTVPTAIGTYNMNYNLTSNNTLQDVSDDAVTRKFEVTDMVMAMDQYDGTVASLNGSFGGWQGGTGDAEIGTYFEVFDAASIGGIQIGIYPVASSQQGTYNGRIITGKIYEIDDVTGDPVLLDATGDYVVGTADYGKVIVTKFQFGTVALVPGKLYVATASCLEGNPVPVSFGGINDYGTTVGFNGATFTNLAGLDDKAHLVETPVVRLDFKNYLGMEDIAKQYGVTAYPNPFNDATVIAFELANDTKVSIKLTDIMGRTVVDLGESNYAAGANKVSIDAAALSAGVYNYTLTIGNAVITNKIVKK